MSIKARSTGDGSYVKRVLVWGGPAAGDSETVSYATGAQYVSSEGHHVRNLGRGGDIGGPMVSQRIEISSDTTEPMWVSDGGRYDQYTRVYSGPGHQSAEQQLANLTEGDAVSRIGSQCPALVPGNDLDSFGATAISRCSPTNPVFDGSTALAELISERKFFAIPGRERNGGFTGEYLNYQLGISPAISAFQEFRSAAQNSESLLEQLQRDSGKLVRRRYEFPPEPAQMVESVETGVYPTADTPLNLYLCGAGTRVTRTWTSQKLWFSGAFTYHLPADVGLSRSIAELDYLYGIKPGVDTAWELIPFSFVADYFSNIGDVVKNVNNFAGDGLVLVYGYVMAETSREVHESWTGSLRIDNVWHHGYEVASKRTYTNKQRRAATPFGFGILDEDLTPRQLSILAALGLNRR